MDPNGCIFGNLSMMLVGDFGEQEPIDDWSMCDTDVSKELETSLKTRLLRQTLEDIVQGGYHVQADPSMQGGHVVDRVVFASQGFHLHKAGRL